MTKHCSRNNETLVLDFLKQFNEIFNLKNFVAFNPRLDLTISLQTGEAQLVHIF